MCISAHFGNLFCKCSLGLFSAKLQVYYLNGLAFNGIFDLIGENYSL